MRVLVSIFAALLAVLAVALAQGPSPARADAFARWDRVGGGWTTGWIRQTPQQYGANINHCGHFHAACRCPGRSACGWYNNGASTYWWIQGCNRRPWVIRCTVRPHVAAAQPNLQRLNLCYSTCGYNYRRCLAPGPAFAAGCNQTYNRCIVQCRAH